MQLRQEYPCLIPVFIMVERCQSWPGAGFIVLLSSYAMKMPTMLSGFPALFAARAMRAGVWQARLGTIAA
jgi:hypothetical protein